VVDHDEIDATECIRVTIDGSLMRETKIKQKIENVEHLLLKEGIPYNRVNKDGRRDSNLIFITVRNQDGADRLLDLVFNDERTEQDGENGNIVTVGQKIPFVLMENRKQIRKETREKSKNRTIQIVNIPIEMRDYRVRGTFEKYGEIEDFSYFLEQKYGISMTAFITYKREESISKFYTEIWSEYIGPHLVYVLPTLLTSEERENRKSYAIKLSGLPFNMTSYDLDRYLREYNAKYWHIPRNPLNNRPKNYAIVYFGDEENFEIATSKTTYFKGKELYWVDMKSKTCHKCGSPDHLYVQCTENTPRQRKVNRTDKLREINAYNNNRRRPQPQGNGRRPQTKTYADATKSRYRNNQLKTNGQNFRHRDINKGIDTDDVNDWDELDAVPRGAKQRRQFNNVSRHEKSLAGEIMKQFQDFKEQLKILENQNKAIQDEIHSMKRKKETVNTIKKGATVNKAATSQTKGKVNDNNKRVKIDETVVSDSSDEEINDLDERIKQTAKQTEDLSGKFDKLASLICSHFDMEDPSFEGDETMDYEENLINI
jgi:prefoldin subunit 5